MKNFKVFQTVALIAILCHQSFSFTREKRSFSWPSFFGGGASADVVENVEPVAEAAIPEIQAASQQQIEIPIQHLSNGYHYPIWRVHKYNGIELKPMPISLVQTQHLQQLHTRVPYIPQQQLHQYTLNQMQGQNFQSVARPNGVQQNVAQPNGRQQMMNCNPKPASAAIPPELQELAQQFGIKDASKLPSLEDAMGLLGTTTRAETIQTIKELAATPDGMNLVRQFLASDEGAAASAEPTANNQCSEASPIPQQFVPQQPNNMQSPPNTNFQQRFSTPVQHQEYAVPKPYPPKQHDVYGLPNQGAYQPQTHIMSLVKNEAVSHEQQANELATALSEHQGYNTPRPNIQTSQQAHVIYGLPNMKPAAPFQGYYAPRSNFIESSKSEGVPQAEYNVPNEESNGSHATQEPHQEYGLPNTEESHASAQHETYGLPNVQEPVNFLQQGPYPPKTDIVEPQNEYGVPNIGESNASEQHETYGLPNAQEHVDFHQQGPYPPKTDIVEPHSEYGVPNTGESHSSEQHETYGLPVQEHVNFHQEGAYPPKTDIVEPHNEYGIPNTGESHASEQHEIYGLPNAQEHVDFHQEGPYPPETDNVESANSAEAIVPHQEYNVPNEVSQQTQVPHETYGIPSDLPTTDNSPQFVQPHQAYSVPEPETSVLTAPHQTYEVANNDNENIQQDQQAAHNEYALPATNAVHQSIGPHDSYALPHQRFFETPNVFTQPQYHQSTQYGAPTKYTSNNQRTNVPILRQIGGALDRTHTNLQLGQLLTTTLRPEAGFLERVGAWTRYFAPPGPTIPINPPPVTEDVNESVDHPQNAYTIPIPMIPELNEPHLSGLPNMPQLPNVHIPRKFLLPPTSNQGPFVRVQLPVSGISSLTHLNDYELPHQQPQPFDGQTVEEFVPDISQLPLDQRDLGIDLRTSYGMPTHPHSYARDSSPAASETNEEQFSVVLPSPSAKHLNTIDVDEIIENDVVDEKPQKKYGPQRISSYDSYATGKLNRADDDAIIQLIPTQKPYTNHARRIEDSSIIDAIATMTSGFRPVT